MVLFTRDCRVSALASPVWSGRNVFLCHNLPQQGALTKTGKPNRSPVHVFARCSPLVQTGAEMQCLAFLCVLSDGIIKQAGCVWSGFSRGEWHIVSAHEHSCDFSLEKISYLSLIEFSDGPSVSSTFHGAWGKCWLVIRILFCVLLHVVSGLSFKTKCYMAYILNHLMILADWHK